MRTSLMVVAAVTIGLIAAAWGISGWRTREQEKVLQDPDYRNDASQQAAQEKKRNAPAAPAVEAGDRKTITVSGTEFAFRWIPPGTDVIGSPSSTPCRDGDEDQWTAKFSKGFWMGETEVTQGQWKAIMGGNPSYISACGDDCPVESVSWNDVQDFIRKLNSRVEDGTFRLPYEAEWEYAARAGSDGHFSLPCGDYESSNCRGTVPCLDRIGWYDENSGGKIHPAGKKSPNSWGLYDMHGNVWEWCQDWKGAYPSGSLTDYQGPGSGKYRVLRGGSWGSSARYLRSADRSGTWSNDNWGLRLADRYRMEPGDRSRSLGFRLALVDVPPG
jgi:formylglycine-generating enzyme required for sulfatase activity